MRGARRGLRTLRRLWMAATCGLVVGLALPATTFGQTAVIEGSLSAFDVVNDSDQSVHGFEIRLEGAVRGDLYYTMWGQRYGNAIVTEDPTGVSIRYESPYDPARGGYTVSTPRHQPGTPFSWNDCYLAGSRYAVSGCEHFGQSLRNAANITKVSGYWLVEDSASAGHLVRLYPNVAIPFASWTIAPPVTATPVVVAKVEAPEPPEAPELFGDAIWVKIFKTEVPRQVLTDELSSDNPTVVPEDPAQVEVDWDILQAEPLSGGNGNRNRSQRQNQGGIGTDTRSVIRRYELYRYTGAYDALTHEVACADAGLCNAPSAGELGAPLGAQNTAANVTPDVLVVTRAGNGTVTSDTGINCGGTCAAFAASGTTATLTAVPGTQVFSGWTGACTGTALTCAVPVTGIVNVGASFSPPPSATASVTVAGSGEVRSADGAIRCSTSCSATYGLNTTVTFTAKSLNKAVFVGWSGACSGTALTCTVTLTANAQVLATFAAAPTGGGGGGGGGGGTTSTKYRLTVQLNGNGTVTANPSGQDFASGTVVTLTATPKVGSPWVGWSGACTGTTTTCTVTMNTNQSVTANFR